MAAQPSPPVLTGFTGSEIALFPARQAETRLIKIFLSGSDAEIESLFYFSLLNPVFDWKCGNVKSHICCVTAHHVQSYIRRVKLLTCIILHCVGAAQPPGTK